MVKNRIFLAATWGTALAVCASFLWLLSEVVGQGSPALSLQFLLSDPLQAGRSGGVGPIVVSTILILGICMAASFPIGLGAAIALGEFTSAESMRGRLIRRSLDVLAGVPSIVFGLFGNALFCKIFGLGFSILSGGLTLACMVLPLIIRSAEEGLRSVQPDVHLASAALGFSRTRSLFSLFLPLALPSIVVGLILGVGRALAETAALIFTSGYVDRMPSSLLDSGRSLSVHIFDLAMNVPGGDTHAYASSLVLVGLIVMINLATHWLSNHWHQKWIIPV